MQEPVQRTLLLLQSQPSSYAISWLRAYTSQAEAGPVHCPEESRCNFTTSELGLNDNGNADSLDKQTSRSRNHGITEYHAEHLSSQIWAFYSVKHVQAASHAGYMNRMHILGGGSVARLLRDMICAPSLPARRPRKPNMKTLPN